MLYVMSSDVCRVMYVSWVLIDGERHSTYLLLTYATRLTFLTVCEIKKRNSPTFNYSNMFLLSVAQS